MPFSSTRIAALTTRIGATEVPRPLARGILVVEDEAVVAEGIHEALVSLGYPVAGVVSTGEDAVRHAEEHCPALVLMDIKLRGGLDGIDAARAIRQRTGAPVVFLSAFSDADTLARATCAEPLGFLVKPFREPDLRCAIEVALRRQKMEEHLRALSALDELTGVHNRRGFRILAEQELKRTHRVRLRARLIFIDLDGLKDINDRFGHNAGDRAIRDTATLLRNAFRTEDIVARIGGDEFVVLCTGDTKPALERLEEMIEHYNSMSGPPPFTLVISTGSAIYNPDEPETLDSLLKRADRAMYEQKARRKATVEAVAPTETDVSPEKDGIRN
jgi:two-component system cell cycle response regulator